LESPDNNRRKGAAAMKQQAIQKEQENMLVQGTPAGLLQRVVNGASSYYGM